MVERQSIGNSFTFFSGETDNQIRSPPPPRGTNADAIRCRYGYNQEKSMTKFLTILAAGSALALVSVAAPTTADARCWGCGAAAVGVIGGIAAGAAIASSRGPYYDGGYAYDQGYAGAPAYAYEGPVYSGDDYGNYGYRRYGGATTDYTNSDRQLQGTR
jgi:hypothetical protein